MSQYNMDKAIESFKSSWIREEDVVEIAKQALVLAFAEGYTEGEADARADEAGAYGGWVADHYARRAMGGGGRG